MKSKKRLKKIRTQHINKKTKLKTHKGAAKRFRVTGSGTVVAKSSNTNHLLAKKSNSRKRRLKIGIKLTSGFAKRAKKLVHK